MAFLHLVLAELDKIYKYDNFCFLLKEAELMLMERMFYPPCSPGTPTCGSTIGPLGLSAISPATPQHPLPCAAPRSARPAAPSAVASGWWWWEVTPPSSPRSQPVARRAPLQGEQQPSAGDHSTVWAQRAGDARGCSPSAGHGVCHSVPSCCRSRC